MRDILSRIAALFTHRRLDAALDEEVRAHLDLLTDDYIRRGMPPGEARLAARRAFGGVEPMKDTYRDHRGLPWVDDLGRDIRYACRTLRRNPGFTAVAVLTLALGIGANTAIFAVVYGYLFERAPVRDPDALVAFRWTGESNIMSMAAGHAYVAGAEGRMAGGTFPIGVFQQIQANSRVLSGVAALAPAGSLNVVADGRAEPASGQFVSGRLFDMLGVSAGHGRVIVAADDRESAEPVVVLSHQYWERRFAMDPEIVGQAITINGVPFIIAGVTPASFRDLSRRGLPDAPDVAIPLALEPRLRGGNSQLQNPTAWWLTVMGRMAPGVTIPQVETAFETLIVQALEASVPAELTTAEARARWRVPSLEVVSARHGLADPAPEVLTRFRILGVIAGIVLLVVCVNVANLLLSRAVSREREIAVRAAIGASRGRIARQLLTESVVLAGMAGAIAPLVAFASGRMLALVAESVPATAAFNGPVLAFAGALSIATALVFGAVPAMRIRSALPALAMRESGSSLSAPRARTAKGLLIAQVALSLPLLVAAGLFLRTLANLRDVDIGFDPKNIVLFTLEPELSGYDRPRAAALYEQVNARLLRVPGVWAVTTSAFGSTLMDGGSVVMFLDGGVEAPMLTVDHNFFATVGIPVKGGRPFGSNDTATSPPVAMVNETFAKRFFPDSDPIGRSFRTGNRQLEIIGIVGDANVHGLREPTPPTIYRTVAQLTLPSRRVVVRTTADAEALIPAIREAMWEVDPHLPLQGVSTQLGRIETRYLANERMFAAASSAVGGLALAVTMIGLFGLMSYTVARRTRELGIRVALGAKRSQVLRSVLGDALILAGIGTAIGLAAAIAMSQFLETLTFRLSPHDPASLAIAASLMFVAAAAAAYVPARRATNVDPVVALRAE